MLKDAVREIPEKKYIKIEIPFDSSLNNADMKIIGELERKFSNDEFSIKTDNEILRVFLKSLDIGKFKITLEKIIELLKSKNPNQEVHTEFFNLIIEKIEDIRSYGIKGKKRVYVTYNDERKVTDRKGKVAKRNIFYYAADHSFSTIQNELPRDYLDRIICGDSLEILKKLPSNSIDVVFTSPPYNFGLEYAATEDGIHWNDYFDKLFAIFNECIRVVKFGGRIIVNVQPLFSDYIPIHHIISNFFIQNKLIWKGEILWEKNNYNCKYTAWGSWKSPSNPYLKYTWEFIEIFCKGDLKKTGHSEDIDINAEEFKKWVVAKWSIAPAKNMKEFDHPAMFPEELVERVLKLFSYQNDIILDPFNGVGTTPVVAKKLGRHYLGIDISDEYCDKAEKRLRNTTIQKRLVVE